MVDISDSIQQAIAVIVITVALLAMTPTIVEQVQGMNTSAWNFTGYQGAIQFLGLIPFIWIAAIVGTAAYTMFRIAKGSGSKTKMVARGYINKLLVKMGRPPLNL